MRTISKIIFKIILVLSFILFSTNSYADSDVERALQIGSSVSNSTQNSILFIGPNGVISQDNATISFNDTQNRLINSGLTSFPTSATQSITGVGSTISADATTVTINGTGVFTLTSTPTISGGYAGQIVLITAPSGIATNGTTIQDKNSLAGSNLQLGAASRLISADDCLFLSYNGTTWNEISFADN